MIDRFTIILDIYTGIVKASCSFDVGATTLQEQNDFSRGLNKRCSFFKLIIDSAHRRGLRGIPH